jgi:hypothetical protein
MTEQSAAIPKGYILKARAIEDSEIAHAPPHVREIWDLCLRKANFRDRKCGDTVIRRGQWLTSYAEIREALHWKVGWRKHMYKKWQCEETLKRLRRWEMVTTRKTTRGLVITVCNYDLYQSPANYENHNGHHEENRSVPQTSPTTTKKGKEGRRSRYLPNSDEFRLAQLLLDLIVARKSDFKKPDLQSWAIHIDRMIHIDGRHPARIEAVIYWCQRDPFWQNNILSTRKLRERLDQIELKMTTRNFKYGTQQPRERERHRDFTSQRSSVGVTVEM